MPRAIWNGSISFGLVNIPIKLYNAVSRKGVSFHQIDVDSGARIKMQRVSSKTGEEVPYERIVKGYYLAPGKGAEKSYALLSKAMEEQGKVALARFVMRTKQYLASVRAKEGMLLLSTMVYADEVVTPEQLPELDDIDSVKVNDKEVAMAAQLIDSLSADFEPERFRDTYRDQVLELIEKKAAGEEIVVEAAPEPEATSVVDLMAALEASVKDAREARKRHPTAVASADEDADEDEDEDDEAPRTTAKAKKTTKKRAA